MTINTSKIYALLFIALLMACQKPSGKRTTDAPVGGSSVNCKKHPNHPSCAVPPELGKKATENGTFTVGEIATVNLASGSSFILKGTCTQDTASIEVRVSIIKHLSAVCIEKTWQIIIDLTDIPDGNIQVTFLQFRRYEVKQLSKQSHTLLDSHCQA